MTVNLLKTLKELKHQLPDLSYSFWVADLIPKIVSRNSIVLRKRHRHKVSHQVEELSAGCRISDGCLASELNRCFRVEVLNKSYLVWMAADFIEYVGLTIHHLFVFQNLFYGSQLAGRLEFGLEW